MYVRKGPIGMAVLAFGPRSFGIRMCNGIWPPS